MRVINQKGIDLLKNFEGIELKAYLCPAGILTIGYGSTGQHVKPGMTITEREAETLLRSDLQRFERCVEASVKVPLTDNQFAALVCFTFNVGEAAFKSSTLLKLLNQGDYEAVPAQLLRWNKAGGKVLNGLTRRREAEGALFLA
jgi:lysozyme